MNYLQGKAVLQLLNELSSWGKTTTIIVHHGCVFEIKAPFPKGEVSNGYFNLNNQGQGFEGHIRLQQIAKVGFQQGQHRNRDSYALVFQTADDDVIFKVFLGRDARGEIFAEQITHFNQLRDSVSMENNHL